MIPRSTDWPRLDRAIQAALSAPLDARENILEDELGDRPDLLVLAREALAAETELPDIASLAPELIESLGQASQQAEDERLSGYRVGVWRIIRPLGRGGMGSVYLGERADGLFERQVAIKLLPYALRSVEFVARFERERSILAGLGHPGIAQLLDGGTLEDGSPYLVLEYVDGEIITDHCDRSAMNLRARLGLLLDVLEVVQFAHRNLVVHRDLKPANIMVDREGRIKLLDFGIAKLMEEVVESDMTASLGARLTPDYAAPEQLLGSRITAASDVYALGCLTYRLLTGRLPLKLGGCSLTTMIETVQSGKRPSLTQVAAAGPLLPGVRAAEFGVDLDAIAIKAIAAEPGERYGSAAEFAADLQRFLDGLPVHARPAGSWYRTRKFMVRHRRGLAATVSAFMVMAATAATALYQAEQARQQRDESLVMTAILKDLMQLANPDVGMGHGIDARAVLNTALEKVLGENAAQPEARIELLETLAQALMAFELVDDAMRARHAIHALHKKHFGAEHPATLAALAQYARALRERRQDFEGVEALFQDVLQRRRQLLGERHPDTAESYWDLGFTYLRFADSSHPGRQQVLELIGRAHDVYSVELGEEHLVTARVLFDLGLATPEDDLKIDRMRRAVEIRVGQVQEDDLQLLQHQGDLAMVLSEAGQVEEALALGRRATEGYQAARGDLHPTSLILLNNLAGMYRDHGFHQEALDTYRRVDERVRVVVPEDHVRRAFPQYGIGRILNTLGRAPEAESFLREAIRVLELNRRDPLIAITRIELGDCLRQQGRHADAAEEYQLASSIYADRLGRSDDDPQIALIRHRLAELSQ